MLRYQLGIVALFDEKSILEFWLYCCILQRTRPEKAGIRESDIRPAEVENSQGMFPALVRKVLFVYMAKTKAEKAVIIDKLESAFKDATSSVFVHFTKVTVAEESAMRRALRNDGVLYFVAKKTLIRRALEKLGHAHAELPLEGEVAVAYGGGEDATIAARLVHEFGKKMVDKLTIIGGIFEGKIVGASQMQEIATIPSMQTLRAMFAQILNSPRQRFAVVLSKVAETK